MPVTLEDRRQAVDLLRKLVQHMRREDVAREIGISYHYLSTAINMTKANGSKDTYMCPEWAIQRILGFEEEA